MPYIVQPRCCVRDLTHRMVENGNWHLYFMFGATTVIMTFSYGMVSRALRWSNLWGRCLAFGIFLASFLSECDAMLYCVCQNRDRLRLRKKTI